MSKNRKDGEDAAAPTKNPGTKKNKTKGVNKETAKKTSKKAPKKTSKKAAKTVTKKTTKKRSTRAVPESEPAPELARPTTPAQLDRFLLKHLDLTIPPEALVHGHTSPREYLCHAFFEDTVPRDCVVWANRGGGKTFLAAVATLLDLVFKPGIEIRILGGSLEQASRMHEHLRAMFEREPFAAMVDGKITDKRIRLRNGSRVELLAQSQTSVRGTRVQKLRCDEVELFDLSVWEAAQLVTREKLCGEVLVPGSIECLSTMHVPHGIMFNLVKSCSGAASIEGVFTHENRHGDPLPAARKLFRWGVLDVLGVCGPEHECASCPLEPSCKGRVKRRDERGDGAAGHITVGEAQRMMPRVSRSTWEAEMLCLRPTRSDCVLPEFDVSRHLVKELPQETAGWLWVCGMDFGIRAPTVVLWAGVDPAGVVWVYDERSISGEVLASHIAAILRGRPHGGSRGRVEDSLLGKRHPKPAWVGIDPAGRQRSGQTGLSDAAVMKNAGLRVRDRRLGVGEGLSLLRARLAPATGEPRLLVHRRCGKLIESLEKYHYPAENPETEAPVKDGSDHAVDALRYLIQNLDKPYTMSKSSYM